MNFLARFLSALVLIPLVLFSLWKGGVLFNILIWIAFAIGLWEIFEMAFRGRARKLEFGRVMATSFFAVATNFWVLFLCSVLTFGIATPLAFGLLMSLIVGAYFLLRPELSKEDWEASLVCVAMVPYIGAGLFAMASLRQMAPLSHMGLAFVLLSLIAIWSNDSFAYLVGKLIGRHKMSEAVSPKKTWEGFAGGSIFCVLVPLAVWVAGSSLDVFAGVNFADILFVCVPTIALAPLGDLIESRIKRLYGVKDSGKLFPGHGGMLDRIDSILCVMPWTFFYVEFVRPFI